MNEPKNIIPSQEHRLGFPTSSGLVKRGLELIPSIISRILRVPEDYPAIETAIKAAQPGDIVEISEGKYNVSLIIDKPISLISRKGAVKLYSASASSPICTIDVSTGEVKIEGIIFDGQTEETMTFEGYEDEEFFVSTQGITITQGKVILSNCEFNSSEPGVGISGYSSSLIVNNCAFFNNSPGLKAENCSDFIINNSTHYFSPIFSVHSILT